MLVGVLLFLVNFLRGLSSAARDGKIRCAGWENSLRGREGPAVRDEKSAAAGDEICPVAGDKSCRAGGKSPVAGDKDRCARGKGLPRGISTAAREESPVAGGGKYAEESDFFAEICIS